MRRRAYRPLIRDEDSQHENSQDDDSQDEDFLQDENSKDEDSRHDRNVIVLDDSDSNGDGDEVKSAARRFGGSDSSDGGWGKDSGIQTMQDLAVLRVHRCSIDT